MSPYSQSAVRNEGSEREENELKDLQAIGTHDQGFRVWGATELKREAKIGEQPITQ